MKPLLQSVALATFLPLATMLGMHGAVECPVDRSVFFRLDLSETVHATPFPRRRPHATASAPKTAPRLAWRLLQTARCPCRRPRPGAASSTPPPHRTNRIPR